MLLWKVLDISGKNVHCDRMKILSCTKQTIHKTTWKVYTGGLFANTITVEALRDDQGDFIEPPKFFYKDGSLCEHIPTVDCVRKFILGTQGRL